MADKTDGTIVDEVEQRLQDLFGEDDEEELEEESVPAHEELSLEKTEDAPKQEDLDEIPVLEEERMGDIEDSPIKELKSIVLSIDWEITDEIMSKFLNQVEKLKTTYQHEKMILMFLQLLGSVGRYIKAKKEASDPDVVKLLNSSYSGMEKVLLTKGLSAAEKKKILASEVNKFKKIKEQISGAKPAKIPVSASPDKPADEMAATPADVLAKPEQATAEPVKTPPRKKQAAVGSRLFLMVFFPLIVIAAGCYVYGSGMTVITSQIDAYLMMIPGVTGENLNLILLLALCGLLFLVGLFPCIYGARLSSKINHLADVSARISEGDRGVAIKVGPKDPLGLLAQNIGRLRDNLK